jgi:hypothetical protein
MMKTVGLASGIACYSRSKITEMNLCLGRKFGEAVQLVT